MGTYDPMFAILLTAASALATAMLIVLLKPALVRYALARPTARSSHTVPTPQGGGIAIMIAVATVMVACAVHGLPGFRQPWMPIVLAAVLLLAVAGAFDDIRPLPVLPRLALQFGAATLLVWTLPDQARALPWIPVEAERALSVIALVWFINLTNFMDGIDWMTVAEVAPVCAALVLLGASGLVPALGTVLPVVLALLGGVIGFAPFNRHVARLFLGDVGSLPIGALVGWLLILLASAGHLMAALILPMYYLADATVTLVLRASRGERVWQAHRSHFYQLATSRGFSVPQVTARVFVLNLFLAAFALISVMTRQEMLRFMVLGLAMLATAALLREFVQGRESGA